MPRVLHVIAGLEVGGAEMALYRLIVSSGARYSHAVASLTPEGRMRQRLLDAGIELSVFDFRKSPVSHFIRLLALIRKSRPDIVQTWMYHADMFGGLAARLAGNRNVIWGIRTTEVNAGGSWTTVGVRRICAHMSSWLPHTIVCVAEAARQRHAAVGYDTARMVVVPNGFKQSHGAGPAERLAFRRECGLADADLVIGTLGRFHRSKDPENFVRAAGLLARGQAGLRFLMVGHGLDAGNAELRGWIERTGHADRFVLLGEREDAPACLASMDIYCLHSRTEGFPNSLGEAMAAGLPCVATDVGDVAMLVADAGVVVPSEDAAGLAGGLERLLAMPARERVQLGQRARRRIESEFTLKRTCERFEEIYQRVMAKGEH